MEKKEMSMEVRLLLAFLLMGLVLVGTQYFYKPPPQPANQPAVAKTTEQAPDKLGGTPAAVPAVHSAASPADIPGQVHADSEEKFTVETDLYRVVFSNRGAVVKSWVLKNFKDRTGNQLELVDQKALDRVPAPFSLTFKNQAPSVDPNSALFHVNRTNDLDVEFEFSDGRAATKKSFKFSPRGYLVGVTSQVTENGVLIPHSIAWRGGFGDQTVVNPVADQHPVYFDPDDRDYLGTSIFATKLREKNDVRTVTGSFPFAGVDDKYFAAVFLTSSKSPIDITIFSDPVPGASGSEEHHIGAAVGGDGLNQFSLFVGPRDTVLLPKVDPRLEQLIDWGTFEFLAKPLFLALNWAVDNLTHNWGWAIILVTFTINLLLFPLRISSMKSSKKMQRLQPQINAINAKYKNLSLRDPKKTEQNQELMDLYKVHGVNPVGGCLPMVLQLPFFYAFYRVLSVTIEMRGAGWLWVHDLSQPETLPIRMLPVILVVTQFLTQRMTPQPGVDQSQQKMMMFMPLVLGYMFYFANSGLVLYWLTGNLVGIVQQVLLNRGTAKAATAVVDVKSTPKKKR